MEPPAVAHSGKHVLAAGVLAAEGPGGGPAHGPQRQRVHLQVVQQLGRLVTCGVAGEAGGGGGFREEVPGKASESGVCT